MTGGSLISQRPEKRNLAGLALGLSIVLSVIFAVIVEYLAAIMFANSAGWRDWAAMSVFIVPLLTALFAIALSLTSHPLWVRLGVAALVLVVPPLILLGVWNA